MLHHPDRVLPLQGATNFRDLGGYAGHQGRRVRWRRLFRSDHLGSLTAADKTTLAGLGLSKALDFRGQAESAASLYELPGVQRHALSIEPTVVQNMVALADSGQPLTGTAVAELMKDLYRTLVNDQAHRFAELIDHVLQADSALVFHCTAGKDRTGLAAAYILLALGVPRDVVMQDYLLTNAVLRHSSKLPVDMPADAMQVLWTVQASFLEAALDTIESDHGGLQRYMHHQLRLTPTAMQTLAERFLEPA